jgi:glycosyltransferase involved in cell wall biosynthesis
LKQSKNIGQRISRMIWYPWVMQQRVAHQLDYIITGSDASADSIVEAVGIPREGIRAIHDGVETEVFRPLDDVEPEENRVLFVGNSEDRNKGIRYLLKALQRLRSEVPFHLRVVHHPGSRGAPKMVQDLGLHGRVTFLEQLSTDELVREYNSAQLLVSPSLYEGFGLPAAEAQACGAPVIATSAGALPEIVEDGVTGLVVPPGDSQTLARAIATLIQEPERCREMGAAGAKRIRERFSWRRTAEETLVLYEEVLAQHRTRTATAHPAAANVS